MSENSLFNKFHGIVWIFIQWVLHDQLDTQWVISTIFPKADWSHKAKRVLRGLKCVQTDSIINGQMFPVLDGKVFPVLEGEMRVCPFVLLTFPELLQYTLNNALHVLQSSF